MAKVDQSLLNIKNTMKKILKLILLQIRSQVVWCEKDETCLSHRCLQGGGDMGQSPQSLEQCMFSMDDSIRCACPSTAQNDPF